MFNVTLNSRQDLRRTLPAQFRNLNDHSFTRVYNLLRIKKKLKKRHLHLGKNSETFRNSLDCAKCSANGVQTFATTKKIFNDLFKVEENLKIR